MGQENKKMVIENWNKTPEEIRRLSNCRRQIIYVKNNQKKIKKKYNCDICSGRYTLRNKSIHAKTLKHQKCVKILMVVSGMIVK
jgi:hypothetical protein